jgi:hypothetical protein
MAVSELCGNTKSSATTTDGLYYGVAFQFKIPGQGDEPAALYTLWGVEEGQWKVIAWEVLTN